MEINLSGQVAVFIYNNLIVYNICEYLGEACSSNIKFLDFPIVIKLKHMLWLIGLIINFMIKLINML